MLKKITAILFLSFASMIILAFAVIPHHHHQDYICFNSLHCEGHPSSEQHSHDGEQDGHEHSCVKNLFQTQISRIQSSVHSCDDGRCFHFIQTLFLSSDILSLLSQKADETLMPPSYYKEKLHSACYISDFSGRAPPRKS